MRAYQREWVAQRREDWIVENGPCSKCKTWDNLQVDHKDAKTKSMSVSKVWALSLDNPKRIAELAKCWVLCEDCHTTKTRANRDNPHGSVVGTSKLDDAKVIEIRSLYGSGKYSQRALARKYGVDPTSINRVVNRKSWTHI